MKIQYNLKHGLLNIEFLSEETVADSVEFDGIIIDYAKDGRVAAIEVLDAGERTVKDPLNMLDLTIVKEVAVAQVY